MIQYGLLLVLGYLVVHLLVKPHRYWKDKGVKHVKPIPLFGNIFENIQQRKSLAEITQSVYNRFKDERYSGMYHFLKPVLLIHDPELIKTLTIKDFDSFTDHLNHANEDVDPLWSGTLFAMIGEPWRDMRSTLSPAFTSSKMRFMFTLIDDCAQHFAEYYASKLQQDVIELEMKDTCTMLTNDTIASCAFGIKCDSLLDRNNEFYAKARKALNFAGIKQNIWLMFNSFPKLMKFLGLKIISDDMGRFFRSVIDDTIQVREDKGISRPDIIHLLLEARKGKLSADDSGLIDSFASTKEFHLGRKSSKIQFTNEVITAQALVFFLGGFDTTSYLMCFLTYELALNPETQDTLREEINATWKECDGQLSYEALTRMKYLDMLICEVLRKWPPFPFTDRICTKDYTIKATRSGERDCNLKRNDVIFLPIFALQRDPAYYPNPDKFIPERFSPENRANLNPSTYIPFGSGPRNCIGSRFAILENKTMIFHLIRSLRVVPVDRTSIPMVISKNQFNISSHHGFWLGLQKLKLE